MDIIQCARELGSKIQEDERYIKFKVASQNNDEDYELQDMIGKLNLVRMNIDKELSKKDYDKEKIKKLNENVRMCYEEILNNKSMRAYNEAKEDFDNLMRRINAIIIGSASGEDPLTVDFVESNCNGNCSGCNGCN